MDLKKVGSVGSMTNVNSKDNETNYDSDNGSVGTPATVTSRLCGCSMFLQASPFAATTPPVPEEDEMTNSPKNSNHNPNIQPLNSNSPKNGVVIIIIYQI